MDVLFCRGRLPSCGWSTKFSPEADWRQDWLGWYCSDACQEIFHKRSKLKEPRDVACVICGTMFVSPRSNARYCSPECGAEGNRRTNRERYEQMMLDRPETKLQVCPWCKETIEVPISYTGNRLYHDECRKQSLRASNLRKNSKRRDVPMNRKVSLELIVQRDGSDCHICNEPIDLNIASNSRMGATVDHVLPVSKGGDSSLENLRLAHWICNIRKSDSLEFIDG